MLVLAEAIDPFSAGGVEGDFAVMKAAFAARVPPLRRRSKMGDVFAEELLPVRTQEPHQRRGLKKELSTTVGRDFDNQVTIAHDGSVICYFDLGPSRWRFA
jgi:hypothetical protein